MSEKYYVVADRDCPGSEHDTWEEARAVLQDLQSKGLKDARILMPPNYTYWGEEETHKASFYYPPL